MRQTHPEKARDPIEKEGLDWNPQGASRRGGPRKMHKKLTESSCFPLIFKPIDVLLQFPGLSQVGATPFSQVYLFTLLFHWSSCQLTYFYLQSVLMDSQALKMV